MFHVRFMASHPCMIYEKASNVKFLGRDFDIEKLPPIQWGACKLAKGARYWEAEYKGKMYSVALTRAGLILGFKGALYPNKLADLLLINLSGYSTDIYERRYVGEDAMQDMLVAREDSIESPFDSYYDVPAEPKGITPYAGRALGV